MVGCGSAAPPFLVRARIGGNCAAATAATTAWYACCTACINGRSERAWGGGRGGEGKYKIQNRRTSTYFCLHTHSHTPATHLRCAAPRGTEVVLALPPSLPPPPPLPLSQSRRGQPTTARCEKGVRGSPGRRRGRASFDGELAESFRELSESERLELLARWLCAKTGVERRRGPGRARRPGSSWRQMLFSKTGARLPASQRINRANQGSV